MIAACGQMEAKTLEQSAEVWPIVERLALQASAAKADLLVLPETTYPAYWLESVERYMRPDILRSAEVLKRFAALARKHAFHLVAGFVEERDGRLFNSAAVFDRAGNLVGIARKNFLWDCDNRWFAPGESLAAFDTEFGRIGVLICADCRAPEIAATLVADGARMLLLPTAWVNASKVRRITGETPVPRTYGNVHPEFLIRARALEFGVPFVCCSKAGREGDFLEYVGQSRIVDAHGQVLAEAPVGGEHLIVSHVQPSEHGAQPPSAVFDWDDPLRARLLSKQAAYRARQPGGVLSINVKRDAASIQSALEASGARVACLTPAELNGFAPARSLALDGVQVLLVHGRIADDVFARARAAENRVFVIAAGAAIQFVIQPDGSFLHREADLTPSVELDLALADMKRFTPETDIWDQRRVECYRFPQPTACAS